MGVWVTYSLFLRNVQAGISRVLKEPDQRWDKVRVPGETRARGNSEDVGCHLATREPGGNLWDLSGPLIPGERLERSGVRAFRRCFCLSRAARTGTPSGPSAPTFHASRLLPSLPRAPALAAGLPASLGRWQPRCGPRGVRQRVCQRSRRRRRPPAARGRVSQRELVAPGKRRWSRGETAPRGERSAC